jgi:carboxylesterase type B
MEEVLQAEADASRFPDIFNFSTSFLLAFDPTIDGSNVMGQPVELFQQAAQMRIPLIMGTNTDEGVMFVFGVQSAHMPDVEYDAILKVLFGSHSGTVKAHYPSCPFRFGFEDCREILTQVATDYIFACPTRAMARAAAAAGQPVFVYNFNHVLSFSSVWGKDYAYCDNVTCHGAELPFVFYVDGLDGYTFTAEERTMGLSMHAYWQNFIASVGDVNSDRLTVPIMWPKFDSQLQQITFSTEPGIHVTQGYKESICDFWDTMGYHY